MQEVFLRRCPSGGTVRHPDLPELQEPLPVRLPVRPEPTRPAVLRIHLQSGPIKSPKVPWMYEPQLVDQNNDPEMTPFTSCDNLEEIKVNQSIKRDYSNSDYTKGHLNPVMHQSTLEDKTATFTLTNIVPQTEHSNRESWNVYEHLVNHTLSRFCTGDAFIVTGVLPYQQEKWIKDNNNNNRVAIPEYMWSAYCCTKHKDNNVALKGSFPFPAFAALGRNEAAGDLVPVNPQSSELNRHYAVNLISLQELQTQLSQRFNSEVQIFHRDCQPG
ncbi:nuclease-like [Amia ocellicauda]|uniref:nuclease-like n=1 Tax=Amia ocellicauda TaxID=2972642 RepID=UPI003463E7C5